MRNRVESLDVLRRTTLPSGMRSLSRPCAISMLSTMLRPTKPTLRPTTPVPRSVRLLNAIDGREKPRNDDPLWRGAEQLFESNDDRAFGRRKTGTLDVGAVTEKRQYAFLSITREGVEVEGLAIDRRGINFEIAGVNDHAERSANGKSYAVDGAVGNVQIFNLKRTQGCRLAGSDFVEFYLVEQAVLFEFLADEREREFRAVNRERRDRR